uniref:Transmembrane protein n=1 Tax=Solanum tuberosum TaxID=4113 RepID=M1D0D9_SOLTU
MKIAKAMPENMERTEKLMFLQKKQMNVMFMEIRAITFFSSTSSSTSSVLFLFLIFILILFVL